ncbi:MAG: hypothetical protein MJE77_12510 [Proteobacteria bacterium]|nr:hypothetical protein [Pseudomonadota bacterium]
MQYRIVELDQCAPDCVAGAKEIAVHDSAYEAMVAMQQAFEQHDTLPNWYLVDHMGQILAGPEDIHEDVST